MSGKDKLKLIISTSLIVAQYFICVIVCLYFMTDVNGLAFGLILGTIFMMLIFTFGYPVWFKDYIAAYYDKKEEKE